MLIPSAGEVIDYSRRLGARRALGRGAYVAANNVLALSILDCVRLGREDVDESFADPGAEYECRFLEPDEVRAFAGELDATARKVAVEAIARGDRCYGVFESGQPANLSCYSPHPTPVLNDLVVHFDSPRWYMYGAWTPPAYRGRRLHALGVLRAALELFDQDVPELVGVCERTNYRSLVSARRMGWKASGALYRVGLGPWGRLGRSRAAGRLGMRLEWRGRTCRER
jgi:hypothetical protein